MSALLSSVVLDPVTKRFLRDHDALEEFETTFELVRSCFPELLGIEVYLQADPDEETRERVVLRVALPRTHDCNEFHDRQMQCYESLVKRLPPTRHPAPVCGLAWRFMEA